MIDIINNIINNIINLILEMFIESFILAVLAILLSFIVMGFILLLRNICNSFNRKRGIKVKEALNKKLSDSGYKIKYIDEFGLARLEDVFYNCVEVYKEDELFLIHDFNPVRFYFSKKESLIEYILNIINRHEKKNVLLLRELLDNVTEEYFKERVIDNLNSRMDFTIECHIIENCESINHKEMEKLTSEYIEKIYPIYMDIYKKLYINAEKENYKVLKNFNSRKDNSDLKDFNFKIILTRVLSEYNNELIEEYSDYLYDLVDSIFVGDEIYNIIDRLDKSILKENI